MRYLAEALIAAAAFIGVLAALRSGSFGCQVILTGHSAVLSGSCEHLQPELIKALGDHLTGLRF